MIYQPSPAAITAYRRAPEPPQSLAILDEAASIADLLQVPISRALHLLTEMDRAELTVR